MSQFDDREKAFEAKFAHDAETCFRARIRRDRLFGLWAAGRMGLPAGEASTYAQSVIDAGLRAGRDEDVVMRVVAGLAEAGLGLPEAELRAALARFDAEAKAELLAERT